jgi:hypothetical protein
LPNEKSSYFSRTNNKSMKAPKLTAFLLALPITFIMSCQSTEELEKENIYYGNALSMTGAQETPAVSTSATGSIDAQYNRLTRILSYKVTFSGLTQNASAAHIHGLGEAGTAAPVVQTFSGFPAAKAGTYSGTFFVDGIKVKEEDILASRYYINIHNSAYPNGEIRGQLVLSK